MKCYAKSSENLIVQLANLPPKPPFLSKSFHLFSCTGKTHYLCISSAKNKEQNKTFLPFNFQNIGRQLVQYAASGNKDVFIVHGHDSGLKNEVARFITDMGYNPIILHEQPNTGKTIIEKIEAFTNVCYAIVLYTPCDKGASKDCPNVQPRARQNVVFEHGYLIGKLGRERVCALIKEEVEKPGDVDGVVYVSYDGRGAWKKDIAKEFNTLGMHFNPNALLY